MGKRIEVGVAVKEGKGMLKDQCGDPHVVNGNRLALLSQLPVKGGVMMGGLLVGVKHANARFQKKSPENGLVVRPLASDGESRAQFAEDDKRQPDLVGRSDLANYGRVATTEIGVAIGV